MCIFEENNDANETEPSFVMLNTFNKSGNNDSVCDEIVFRVQSQTQSQKEMDKNNNNDEAYYITEKMKIKSQTNIQNNNDSTNNYEMHFEVKKEITLMPDDQEDENNEIEKSLYGETEEKVDIKDNLKLFEEKKKENISETEEFNKHYEELQIQCKIFPEYQMINEIMQDEEDQNNSNDLSMTSSERKKEINEKMERNIENRIEERMKKYEESLDLEEKKLDQDILDKMDNINSSNNGFMSGLTNKIKDLFNCKKNE